MLEQAGCAAVDLSMGIQESPGAGFDPMQYPQGWTMYASEAIKKVVRIPVITSHSLRDPEYCEQILAEGKTDLVGLSRQLLADPYWPVKAKYGKVKQIRRCISCLGGCWQESLMAKKEIACSINAACGNPAYAEMKRSAMPVRVAVVGGGPAGMEAARIATERGHHVTLFEKARRARRRDDVLLPGAGQGEDALVPRLDPGPAPRAARRRPAEPRADRRRSCRASTSCSTPPARRRTCRTSWATPARVVPFEESMACPKIACECHPGGRRMRKLGARVLLWGDHYAAADTAAFLASIGKEVTIVTENREFGAELEVIHMYVQRKRFAQGDAEVLHGRPYKHPVTILTNTTVHEIRHGEVVLQDKDFTRTTIEVDDVVTCHVRPSTELLGELRAAGVRVLNVGDAVRPRNLYHAVKEGSDFGLAVDEHLLFNSNNAVLNDLPIDVLAQLTRDEEPTYSAKQMLALMEQVNGHGAGEAVRS